MKWNERFERIEPAQKEVIAFALFLQIIYTHFTNEKVYTSHKAVILRYH